MRILHVVRQFCPAVGGLENFVLCLARSQLLTGHQPEVLSLNTVFHQNHSVPLPEHDLIEGVPVRRVPWVGSYKYPIALSAVLRLSGFDIIHVHAVDFFADYLSLTRLLHKTPLVLSTHGGYFHSTYASFLKKVFFNTITRFSVAGYQRVIACSEGDYSTFSPICQPWLRLIENGVDIEKFADQGSRNLVNSLLFIGRFSSNKRIDLLLKTIYYLKHQIPDVRLTIVGHDWDGNLDRLRLQIDLLELNNHVNVMLDLDDSAIRAQIKMHCFVVSASDYEGFGMTLVEGMAAGLVPIASPIRSFTRIVEEAGVGCLVNFHNPEIAARTIAAYIQELKGTFQAIRDTAICGANRYGWAGTSARFMNIYEELLGSSVRKIQGVSIDTRSGAEIVRVVDSAIENRTPLSIAIANVHTINLAREQHDYQRLLKNFLVLNDGAGVNLASKWKYRKPFCENLNGTDFVPRLLAETNRPLRVYLFGARPEVVKMASQRLAELYPRHQMVGYQHGYLKPSDEESAVIRIRETTPDLLLVAMGNPLQERWIARYAERSGATVCVGVGALFDFVAGEARRAPLWVRQIRCEWIFRLTQEPRRMWRRYLIGNLVFLWAARKDRI